MYSPSVFLHFIFQQYKVQTEPQFWYYLFTNVDEARTKWKDDPRSKECKKAKSFALLRDENYSIFQLIRNCDTKLESIWKNLVLKSSWFSCFSIFHFPPIQLYKHISVDSATVFIHFIFQQNKQNLSFDSIHYSFTNGVSKARSQSEKMTQVKRMGKSIKKLPLAEGELFN